MPRFLVAGMVCNGCNGTLQMDSNEHNISTKAKLSSKNNVE